MSNNRQTTTPEQLVNFQAHAQKMMARVIELNATTPHRIIFHISGTSDNDVNADLYWYINSDLSKNQQPQADYSFAYSWLSIKKQDKWFRDAHIGLDLLVAENKAA